MGYECPVCEDPQADGHHLANHLAFTAMLGDDDHAAWLDETVPGWADADPADLAAAVTDYADETEFPQVFEGTTGEGGHAHDHGHDHPRDGKGGRDAVAPGGVADVENALGGDADVESVLAEARELTRQRWTEGDEKRDGGADDGPGDGTDGGHTDDGEANDDTTGDGGESGGPGDGGDADDGT